MDCTHPYFYYPFDVDPSHMILVVVDWIQRRLLFQSCGEIIISTSTLVSIYHLESFNFNFEDLGCISHSRNWCIRCSLYLCYQVLEISLLFFIVCGLTPLRESRVCFYFGLYTIFLYSWDVCHYEGRIYVDWWGCRGIQWSQKKRYLYM